MIGTRIRTISSHQLARDLLDWTENGQRYMCREAEKHLGAGAQFILCKLLEEEYPGSAYYFTEKWKNQFWWQGSCDPINVAEQEWGKKNVPDWEYETMRLGSVVRQEFISRLLTRPDRQLCWLCMSGEEKA